MTGETNSFGGASSSSGGVTTSVIHVYYPSGFVCTCSKDGNVMTAGDTTGYWMFTVNDIGNWTVDLAEAEDVDEYDPIVVHVSKFGIIRSVEFHPWNEHQMIKNGVIASNNTFAYRSNLASGYGELTDDGPHLYAAKASNSWIEGYLETPVQIKPEYSKLVVTYTGLGYMLTVGLRANVTAAYTSVSGNFAVYNDGGRNTQRTNYTVEIDISSIVPNKYASDPVYYYFAFRTAGSNGNYTGNLTIHDAHFE